ncbi:caspase family protein [Oxynema aestuarii]|uniref:DUF4384 domain-containing protein n=1 Tax=Oxynema aestuarii AP17 TaxID=2064643 RepID=A0A6H1TX54_9CYAN|nr:caspase family protein [Oxynema aestuarii]QIZ70727.1 DUF4384 domain-containing protein [Oxynema aestuarii AP17]
MALKRREFLQRASSVLAALGLGETTWLTAGDRYYRALAQNAPRKLALLVGIDQYPNGTPLSGCATDVQLQKQLLVHRFGFDPENTIALIDAQATREQIEKTFISHLIERAEPGDLVVFHFSGYGRRIDAEDSPEGVQNTLVPFDGGLPSDEDDPANDILGETLNLLLGSLKTKQAIAVLDTSFVYPGHPLQGNLRVRSRPSPPGVRPSTAELAFQKQLRGSNPFGNVPSPFQGVVLAASQSDRVATETHWNDFSAGLFTYALTQQLWSATAETSLQSSFEGAKRVVRYLSGQSLQKPTVLKRLSPNPVNPPTKIDGDPLPAAVRQGRPAEGVVTSVEDGGQTAQLWLGGLPVSVLDNYQPNSLFIPLPLDPSDPPGQPISMRSRDGLTAKAQVLGTGKPNAQPPRPTRLRKGQLIQEAVRVIPRNISLTIALDAGLERIERVDATSAFAGISRVSQAIAGEHNADYLFGRAQDAWVANLPSTALPSIPPGSYALFSLGKDLLAHTVGERGEAIKSAAQRLVPELQTLLAAKFLRLSANQTSSQLGVRVTLETVAPEERALIQLHTPRAGSPPKKGSLPLLNANGSKSAIAQPPDGLTTIALGSRIRYRVENYGDRPIYCIVFALDNSGSPIALYPSLKPTTGQPGQTQPTLQQNAIAPGQTATVPGADASSAWAIHGSAGISETQVICSASPFQQTFASLSGSIRPRGDVQPMITLQNPLSFAQAVLHDLNDASSQRLEALEIGSDRWALDTSVWATLSFIYRVT